jgi:hypothetical protein
MPDAANITIAAVQEITRKSLVIGAPSCVWPLKTNVGEATAFLTVPSGAPAAVPRMQLQIIRNKL